MAAKDRWLKLLRAGQKPGDGRLVAESFERPKAAKLKPLPADLDSELEAALKGVGIDRLYTHQAASYRAAGKGNTMITTGTASGKSLCFNLPVLNGLLGDPAARALYLYPTKALAQDQARKLSELTGGRLRFAIYDGDTPGNERAAIRKSAQLVLTNPDMLHIGILPHHESWGDFLTNLSTVVVDEAHVYRGVFGSNVANVIRRLRRVAGMYGADPKFILTSATIANPSALAEELCGLPFQLIEKDGAPTSGREVVIWNPPLLDRKSGSRRSVLSEAADLLSRLVSSEVRTICFTRSRRATELVYRFSQTQLEEKGDRAAGRIAPYRAGYTPQQRRDLERRLATGELLGVVATSALELGIDIGHLDAAICVTYPGTVASLKQRWGRAGRESEGLALYMAGEDALDQYFCRNPERLLKRPVEAAILDHGNENIFMQHLLAAAYEGPLSEGDDRILGPGLQRAADALASAGMLRKHRGRYLMRQSDFPARRISLRSASTNSFDVIEVGTGEMLGTVEAERAFSTTHPGAVYLHLGQSYEVVKLDIKNRRALVSSFDGDYFTQPKLETEILIEEALDSRAEARMEVKFGMVSVTEQVIAYQKKRLTDHEVLDLVTVDLPEQNFLTQALWYELTEERLANVSPEDVLGSLHAVEHAQIAVLPMLAMCDRWDIGGLSTNRHFQTGSPTIFIYDGYPGGIGIARQGFLRFEELCTSAKTLVSDCPCESGCPSCIQSPKCGNLNEPLSKAGSLELLDWGPRAAGKGGSTTKTRNR